ncbi:MAG: hypothetical protein EZS28_014729 [Streblomastix strix]|uniref:Replication factor A C-terminal domain-containing protein n=1 Tax=Streblomastix strix TaxID=222440 RepID=A0A5J4W520_9EUKA|nr:MAG: hypothetical protein EZS28_014729 [Streblomastix strix]
MKYYVNLLLCDSTGSDWVNLFAQRAEDLFKMKALDLYSLQIEQPDRFNSIRNGCLFEPKLWKIRASPDTKIKSASKFEY